MLRPGLRHPVPAAAHGRPLQTVLQHVRQRRFLRHRLPGQGVGRRAAHEPPAVHLLPRMERQRAIVSVPDAGHGPVAHLGDRLLHADALLVRVRQAAAQLGLFALRRQHPRGRGARVGVGRRAGNQRRHGRNGRHDRPGRGEKVFGHRRDERASQPGPQPGQRLGRRGQPTIGLISGAESQIAAAIVHRR